MQNNPSALEEAVSRVRALADKREAGVQKDRLHVARGGTYWSDEDTNDARTWALVPGVSLFDLRLILDALATQQASARALVAKLDECGPHIGNAFVLQAMRNGPYSGPTYGVELEALRGVLANGGADAE